MVWLKRMNKYKVKGFTLVEMVITLTIVVSLVMLGTIEIQQYREKMILTNTAQEVKSSIEQAARIATIRHEAAYIRYYPGSKSIRITSKGYLRKIKINPHIEIYNLSGLAISATGSMPPHTITISDHKNSKRIKLQMTWGRAVAD